MTKRVADMEIVLSDNPTTRANAPGMPDITMMEYLLIASFILLIRRYTDQDQAELDILLSQEILDYRWSGKGSMNWNNDLYRITVDAPEDLSFTELKNRVFECLRDNKPTATKNKERSQIQNKHGFQIKFLVDKDENGSYNFTGNQVFLAENVNHETEDKLPSLQLLRVKEQISATLWYYSDLRDQVFGEKLLEHFLLIVQQAIHSPEKKISSFEILTNGELINLLYHRNSTDAYFPSELCLHQLIERQAAETPEATALIHQEQKLTYKQLNEKANRVADHLIHLGIRPDDAVAVFIDLSFEAVVAILGVLKAGGAYLPLSSDCPPSRLQYIIDHAQPAALLLQRDFVDRIDFDCARTLVVDEIFLRGSIGKNPVTSVSPNHLAYIIYTSGSTGPPKGVMIEHKSVVNNISLVIKRYELTEKDTVLSMPSLAFDASVSKLFPILTLGGAAVLPRSDEVIDIDRLVAMINRYKIPYFASAPSVLRIFNQFNPDFSMLRVITSGGELLRYSDINNIIKQVPVLNVYGPTEATVSSCSYKVPQNELSNFPEKLQNVVPIGRPNPNCKIYILDRHLNVMPEGCFGTLFIGGVGIARGYVHDEKLTAEKFISNPFAPSQRLYNTGDIARWLPDGNLEFFGRSDNLVKVRGYRVSLEEIEETILKFHPISSCKVILHKCRDGNTMPVAFLVKDEQHLSISELKRFLEKNLPSYMIPSEFILLDNLPLNQNNKVDSHALQLIYKQRKQTELKLN